MEYKTCSNCEVYKNLELFSFRDKKNNKRHSICKECHACRVKAHYSSNRDSYIASAASWKNKNQDRRKEIVLKWARLNPKPKIDKPELLTVDADIQEALRKRISEYKRRWNAKNKDKVDFYSLKSRLSIKYNISVVDYNDLLNSQGHACKLCGGKNAKSRSLAVDHCHKTGKVRGLLCTWCNVGIGMFKDNPDLMRSAIEYLST